MRADSQLKGRIKTALLTLEILAIMFFNNSNFSRIFHFMFILISPVDFKIHPTVYLKYRFRQEKRILINISIRAQEDIW